MLEDLGRGGHLAGAEGTFVESQRDKLDPHIRKWSEVDPAPETLTHFGERVSWCHCIGW